MARKKPTGKPPTTGPVLVTGASTEPPPSPEELAAFKAQVAGVLGEDVTPENLANHIGLGTASSEQAMDAATASRALKRASFEATPDIIEAERAYEAAAPFLPQALNKPVAQLTSQELTDLQGTLQEALKTKLPAKDKQILRQAGKALGAMQSSLGRIEEAAALAGQVLPHEEVMNLVTRGAAARSYLDGRGVRSAIDEAVAKTPELQALTSDYLSFASEAEKLPRLNMLVAKLRPYASKLPEDFHTVISVLEGDEASPQQAREAYARLGEIASSVSLPQKAQGALKALKENAEFGLEFVDKSEEFASRVTPLLPKNVGIGQLLELSAKRAASTPKAATALAPVAAAEGKHAEKVKAGRKPKVTPPAAAPEGGATVVPISSSPSSARSETKAAEEGIGHFIGEHKVSLSISALVVAAVAGLMWYNNHRNQQVERRANQAEAGRE